MSELLRWGVQNTEITCSITPLYGQALIYHGRSQGARSASDEAEGESEVGMGGDVRAEEGERGGGVGGREGGGRHGELHGLNFS